MNEKILKISEKFGKKVGRPIFRIEKSELIKRGKKWGRKIEGWWPIRVVNKLITHGRNKEVYPNGGGVSLWRKESRVDLRAVQLFPRGKLGRWNGFSMETEANHRCKHCRGLYGSWFHKLCDLSYKGRRTRRLFFFLK